ncbi:uncharacterized [Tachysurus ichikawai]
MSERVELSGAKSRTGPCAPALALHCLAGTFEPAGRDVADALLGAFTPVRLLIEKQMKPSMRDFWRSLKRAVSPPTKRVI